MEEAGVGNNTENIVADGVGAAVLGMNRRRTRGDIISHINCSRDLQASQFWGH